MAMRGNMRLLEIAFLIAGFTATAAAQMPDLDQEMIGGMVPLYYAAVQNEDVDGLASMQAFADEAARQRFLEMTKMMFAATDTVVRGTDVSKISIHPDRTLATAFVRVQATVFNDDRTDSFDSTQDLVFVTKKVAGQWRLLQIMPRAQYLAAVQVDALGRRAAELHADHAAEENTQRDDDSWDIPVDDATEELEVAVLEPYDEETLAYLANAPVRAEIMITPANPTEDDQLEIDSLSTGPTGATLRLRWFVDGEEETDMENEEGWGLGGLERGEHVFRLVVEDENGNRDEVTKTIVIR